MYVSLRPSYIHSYTVHNPQLGAANVTVALSMASNFFSILDEY